MASVICSMRMYNPILTRPEQLSYLSLSDIFYWGSSVQLDQGGQSLPTKSSCSDYSRTTCFRSARPIELTRVISASPSALHEFLYRTTSKLTLFHDTIWRELRKTQLDSADRAGIGNTQTSILDTCGYHY